MPDPATYRITVASDDQEAIYEELQDSIDGIENEVTSIVDGWLLFYEVIEWYDPILDVATFSLRYPDLLFTLDCQEEDGIWWRAYIRNSQVQAEQGEISFPPANPARMGALASEVDARQSANLIVGQDRSFMPSELKQVRLTIEGGIIDVVELDAGVCLTYDDVDEDASDDDLRIIVYRDESGEMVRRVELIGQTQGQAD